MADRWRAFWLGTHSRVRSFSVNAENPRLQCLSRARMQIGLYSGWQATAAPDDNSPTARGARSMPTQDAVKVQMQPTGTLDDKRPWRKSLTAHHPPAMHAKPGQPVRLPAQARAAISTPVPTPQSLSPDPASRHNPSACMIAAKLQPSPTACMTTNNPSSCRAVTKLHPSPLVTRLDPPGPCTRTRVGCEYIPPQPQCLHSCSRSQTHQGPACGTKWARGSAAASPGCRRPSPPAAAGSSRPPKTCVWWAAPGWALLWGWQALSQDAVLAAAEGLAAEEGPAGPSGGWLVAAAVPALWVQALGDTAACSGECDEVVWGL